MKRPPTHRPKVGPGGTFENFAHRSGPTADSERVTRREEFSLELGGLNAFEFGFDSVFVDGPGDEEGVLVGAVCFYAGGRTSQIEGVRRPCVTQVVLTLNSWWRRGYHRRWGDADRPRGGSDSRRGSLKPPKSRAPSSCRCPGLW